jgi:hypothetical protein
MRALTWQIKRSVSWIRSRTILKEPYDAIIRVKTQVTSSMVGR